MGPATYLFIPKVMTSRNVSKSLKRKSNHRFLLQALGFACLSATAALSSVRAQTAYTWDGGTGSWENSAEWNPTVTPDGASADVYIDGGKTATASVVTMNNSHTVGRLTVDAGDTLNIGNNVDFYLASSFAGSESIINNGTINFNSAGNGVYLHYIGANASLTGTGTMNLLGGNDLVFAQNGGGDRLTIGAGSTIAGNGNLGIGQSTFTNNGTVNANLNGATLTLQPGGGNGSDFTNGATGIAQASNGGILALQGNVFSGAGVFRALAGSRVNIGGSATVSNTTLTTVGTGEVHITDAATLTNVTNSGTLIADNNSTTSVTGTLTNNGTFNLNSAGNGDDLRFTAATLAGTGTLNLNGASDRVFANNGGGDRLTIAAGATLAGNGNLGIGQSTFTNNGTVNANQNGLTLTLQPGGGNGSDYTNGPTGVTEATNGGILTLQGGGNFNNGAFQALTGSTVNIGSGANVNNATLSTAGTGTVVLTDTASLTNVTTNGTVNASNNSTTYVTGTLTNNGTFNLNSAGNGDDLRFTAATLAGTGTLNLNGASDRVFANNGGGDRLIIAAGATIAGNGNLGVGQSTFTNNGTVNANQSGLTLTLQPGGGQDSAFTSAAGATTEATNGGILVLQNGGSFTGAGGFNALNGSQIILTGNPNVNATTLTTTGTGTVTNTDTASLTNVTTNGTVNASNNSTTYVTGTLTNNGTFNLNSLGNGDDFRFVGNTTLNGTGTLNLNGASDRVFANNGGGDRLTIAAGATIAGNGNLGVGQSTFTNNGTVNANQNGATLTLQPGGGQDSAFTSAAGAITEATNGGILVLQNGGSFTGAGGFQALAGSQLNLTGNPNVNSTTLSAVGTGTINLLDTASLTNVTTNGTVNASNNSTTYVTGTLTNNGTFNLNSLGNGDDFRFVGNTTLNGTGTLNLNGASDRVFANNGGGDRLTIAAGATIAGNGNLGVGQSTFTNNGTVNANQSGLTLTLQPGGGNGNDFTTGATGVTEATGGGVMVQTVGSFTNNGTYAVVSGSTGGGSSLSVDAGHLTNFAGTTLTGGTYNVISTNTAATSTLSFGGGTITTNAASVTLSGASTVFTEINSLATNTGSFAVANGRNFTTAGALANSGTLVAAGGSVLTVPGGLTQTSTGTLTGAGTFASPVKFMLSGNVNPGGTINPATGAFADAAGTTNLNGDVAFDVSTKFHFELGSITGTNDHLNITGGLNLNGTLNVTALAGFGAGTYDLIDHGALPLVTSGLTLGTLPSGFTYTVLYLPTQVDLVVLPGAIPEPGAWTFVLGGGALLLGVQRLRRRGA